ncbi:MAG: HDOD domain-containing protein [Rubrivivax sp.]|nr:HDOD domain-containing protein [Rubrivivax sp.]
MKFIDDVLAGRIVLPMVPKVILQLLTELRREDVRLTQVAQLIEQDPVLGSRILRMANTSYFGGRRTVDSLQDAVSLIGARPLTTLLVASGAQAAFAEVPAVNLKRFWEASQRTAVASRLVATRMKLDKDAAYSAGLLCAVGHLILCQAEPDKARRTFNTVRLPWGAELARKEESSFGVSHPQVSAIWVDKLGMPAHVVRAIDMCHSGPSLAAPPLARSLQIGSALAAWLMSEDEADRAPFALPEALLAAASLKDYLVGGGAQEDLQALSALAIST